MAAATPRRRVYVDWRFATAGYRHRMKLAVLLAGVTVAAGCGGSKAPQLAHTDAAPLIALTHRISAEGACAQARDIPKLQAQATALVNRHRVPAELQDSMMSGVNALGALAPVCLPTVAPQATTTVSPPPAPLTPAHRKPKPKPRHHEHEHGHGKKKH